MRSLHIRVQGGTIGNAPSPGLKSLNVEFDTAFARLQAFPRLFIEPDGSFVWRGANGGEDWQIDGQLHDAGPSLFCVELTGMCPDPEWRRLLDAIRAEGESLTIELVQVGKMLDEETFLRRLEIGDPIH
jgi:hypothetical protein